MFSWMLPRIFPKLAFLMLAAVTCVATAQAQDSATGLATRLPTAAKNAQPNSVQTIDASRLDSVIVLDVPWSFHAGDDAHYADPSFDDSAWPQLKPNQSFASTGLPVLNGGYSWARLHLHIVNVSGPLGIAIARLGGHGALDYSSLTRNGGLPFVVYANGQKIATSRNVESRREASIV